ncbi:MAG: glycosyltransferase [Candidatus Spechtbacteria bacterium]|nr:glycosyltransferase [Candidatus Spechtbacteria bacterium]
MAVYSTKKIALVHDYLLRLGGAERVLKVLHEMFPDAPIYAVVYEEGFVKRFFGDVKVRGSFLQHLPSFLRRRYTYLSFLIPIAVEQLDLAEFDIVISSCSAFCKGVLTRPDAIHFCYCHTPTRFLWDFAHAYSHLDKARGMAGFFGRILFHFLRIWDREAARRVDFFIANSKHIAKRIRKYYGREAKVIYPPVEIGECGIDFRAHSRPASAGLRGSGGFGMVSAEGGPKPPSNPLESNAALPPDVYYLIVSQLRAYKEIDVAIEAFKKLGFTLVIIGEGDERKRLEALAKGFQNIQFLGWQRDEVVARYYEQCYALIFPGEEDFGMTMVEAMASGKPVLALRRGGAKEIVIEGITGEFFDDTHPVVLADGVRRLRQNYSQYSPHVIQKIAQKFSKERFSSGLLELIEKYCTMELR